MSRARVIPARRLDSRLDSALDYATVSTAIVESRSASVSADEWEAFLVEIREGRNRAEAATTIGRTGSFMRHLVGTSPDRKVEYDLARTEGRASMTQELRSELRRRLIDEKVGSDRLLEYALATHDPEWEWMRNRSRSVEPGESQTDFRLAPPLIDVSKLTDAQMAKLDESLRTVEFLVGIGQGRIANPEMPTAGVIEVGEAA